MNYDLFSKTVLISLFSTEFGASYNLFRVSRPTFPIPEREEMCYPRNQ